MDYRRQFKRLAHIGRFLALFFACLAFITLLLWRYMPERINRLDEWIVEKHTEPYESRLQQAVDDIERGEETSGIHQLEALLGDLESIRKRDRLDSVKRKSFQMLTRALIKTNQHKQARDRFDDWIAFDDKDVNAFLGKAKMMCEFPDYSREGESLLTELIQKFPTPAVLEPYVQRDKTNPKLVGLFLALDVTDETPAGLARAFMDWAVNRHKILGHWRVFCNTGQGFQKDRIQTVFPEWIDRNTLRFTLTLPREIQTVYVGPPVGNLIAQPAFQVHGPPESANIPSSDRVLRGAKMAEPWKGIFLPAWDIEPLFARKILEQEKNGEPLTGTFQARIFPTLILYITGNDQAKAVRKELAEMGSTKLASVFSEIWALWQQSLPAKDTGGKRL